jgi:predicted Zn-dependent peptidase
MLSCLFGGSSMAKISKVEKRVLPNGMTLVVERFGHYPSVTAGVWVKMGSRHEPKRLCGVSHFIEHLLFKGTPTRSYMDIYKAYDRMGGVLDAFTSREIMGFYFRVQKANFPEAFEVLSDMLARPLFPPEELERERGVILEEIKMVNDTPSDLMGDLFMARAYPGHPLGSPTQGDAASVGSLTRARVRSYYKTLLQPQNLVVTATGDIDLGEVNEAVAPILARMEAGAPPPCKAPAFKPGVEVFAKDHLEQAQLSIAFPSEPASGPGRHILLVLANLLGGTMSSRLFTEIREKLGLVYSIAAEHAGFTDTGIFGVTAATGHGQAAKTLRETLRVLHDIAAQGPGAEELEVAKENLLGGMILSMESPSARMGRLARNELYLGRQAPLDDVLKGVSRVAAKDVTAMARKLFKPENALVAVLGKPSATKGLDLSLLDRKN